MQELPLRVPVFPASELQFPPHHTTCLHVQSVTSVVTERDKSKNMEQTPRTPHYGEFVEHLNESKGNINRKGGLYRCRKAVKVICQRLTSYPAPEQKPGRRYLSGCRTPRRSEQLDEEYGTCQQRYCSTARRLPRNRPVSAVQWIPNLFWEIQTACRALNLTLTGNLGR